jgi:hypothetical protein
VLDGGAGSDSGWVTGTRLPPLGSFEFTVCANSAQAVARSGWQRTVPRAVKVVDLPSRAVAVNWTAHEAAALVMAKSAVHAGASSPSHGEFENVKIPLSSSTGVIAMLMPSGTLDTCRLETMPEICDHSG